MAGGIIADLKGGKFGHGFISAGLTKLFNVNQIPGERWYNSLSRITAAAIVGGSISEQTGGKFKNGALTAAFAQAFNGESSRKRANAQTENNLLQDQSPHVSSESYDTAVDNARSFATETVSLVVDQTKILAKTGASLGGIVGTQFEIFYQSLHGVEPAKMFGAVFGGTAGVMASTAIYFSPITITFGPAFVIGAGVGYVIGNVGSQVYEKMSLRRETFEMQ